MRSRCRRHRHHPGARATADRTRRRRDRSASNGGSARSRRHRWTGRCRQVDAGARGDGADRRRPDRCNRRVLERNDVRPRSTPPIGARSAAHRRDRRVRRVGLGDKGVTSGPHVETDWRDHRGGRLRPASDVPRRPLRQGVVDAPRDVRLARGVARDGESSRSTWLDVWMPNEAAYIDRDDPVSCAHLVIDGSRPFT